MHVLQAEVNVGTKNLDQALALFLPLVKQHPEDARIANGFANTAAKSSEGLSEQSAPVLVADCGSGHEPGEQGRIAAWPASPRHTRPSSTIPSRRNSLALKAAAMDPKDPIVRREVAYVLAHPRVGL